jgi:DNA-binding XRE family transcriptional regulator
MDNEYPPFEYEKVFIPGLNFKQVKNTICFIKYPKSSFSSSSELVLDIVLKRKVEFRLLMALEDSNEREQLFPEAEVGQAGIVSIGEYKFDFKNLVCKRSSEVQIRYRGRLLRLTMLAGSRKTDYPLLNIYTMLKCKRDDLESAIHLAKHFGINVDDVFEDFEVPSHSKWTRYNHNINDFCYDSQETITFSDKNNLQIFNVKLTNHQGTCFMLPETTWIRQGIKKPLVFNIMPSPKFPLFNLEGIKNRCDDDVFITDCIPWADINTYSDERVWTAWCGGYASIKHVDWKPLRGRKVIYLMNAYSFNQEEQVTIALKLYEHLAMVENIDLRIYQDDSIGYSKISLDKLICFADNLKVSVPGVLRRNLNRFIRGNSIDKVIPPEFIVEPVIKKRNLVILYAPSGVGKSWLGLSIGLAVANGVDVFRLWHVPSAPRKVYYVLGEMDEDEIKSRVAVLKKIYQNQPNEDDYFNMRRDQFDLTSEEGQRKIELDIKDLNAEPGGNVSLLVLDNLSTLVRNGDYSSSWNVFFNWLEKLKKKGITILLIHHANKEGDFLGTSGIKNKTDFLIHASNRDEIEEEVKKIKKAYRGKSKNNVTKKDLEREIMRHLQSRFNSKIKMYLGAKKLRSSSTKDVPPLVVSLDPDSPNPEWKVNINRHYLNWEEYLKATQANLDSFEEYSDDLDNVEASTDKTKLFPPPRRSILKMGDEEQAEWIRRCYFEGDNMTTEKMAKFFGVSKKSIYNIRKKTNTKCEHLKDGASEESLQKNES